MNKWIRFSDRLPEKDQQVLTYWIDREIPTTLDNVGNHYHYLGAIEEHVVLMDKLGAKHVIGIVDFAWTGIPTKIEEPNG